MTPVKSSVGAYIAAPLRVTRNGSQHCQRAKPLEELDARYALYARRDVYGGGGMACARGRCAPPAPPRRGDARASALLPHGPRVQAVRRTGAGPTSWGGEGGRVLRSCCALFVFGFYR